MLAPARAERDARDGHEYATYTACLVLAAQQHAVLPAFSNVILGYVMPITVITLIVSVMRHNRKGNG